jgi:diaminohydroxyphosphoribosylaminopyrimidine deaminase/5-amino-6-(5-phosphoribosylamino)uracil reductase
MRRAIELARKGRGWVNPNPMVGAVIVKDRRIIGEGYHRRYGMLHAEREALLACTESPRGAEIYVTLEPCAHQGKQPPCTGAIIDAGLSRVVIGSFDPNPLVSGKGAALLRQKGIEVEEGFLKEECDALNPVFFHYITTGRPYVKMKYAMTADGRIATYTGDSKWISCEESRRLTHRWRHECMGIMVGMGTVRADDPMLTCRIEGGRDPVRIICDTQLSLSGDSNIFRSARDVRTIAACCCRDEEKTGRFEEAGIEVLSFEGDRVPLLPLMDRLGGLGIDSILLEGGATLNECALREGIVNEVNVFIAPKIFGGDGRAPVEGEGIERAADAYLFETSEVSQVGDDVYIRYVPRTHGS